MAELIVGLAQYCAFYNAERPHQALGYAVPDHVYRAGCWGGALIADKFGDTQSNTGRRRTAAEVEMDTA
jgi:putative transposase